MSESNDKAPAKGDKKKKKRKIGRWILLGFVVLLIAGAFEFKLLKIPKCHPAIQEEVDWPPEEPGFYEEASHNRLRTLEAGGFSPPGTVSLCNVPGAPAAQVVAHVPSEPRFLIFEDGQDGWEYHFYHSVDVPETGECVRVRVANRMENLDVSPDPNDGDKVWIRPPGELENGQTYMLTFGADVVRGIIVTVGSPGG